MNKPKKLISVTVDHDLWFYHRNKETNISQLVNEVLRVHKDSETVSNKELAMLEKELALIEQKEKALNENKTKTQILIMKKKNELEIEHEREMAKVQEMDTMLDAGGQFRDMV